MKTKRAIQILATLLLITGLGQAIWAQGRLGNRWDYLGESNVDGLRDHDEIRVGRDDGRFRAIRFKVERAPIEFNRVVIHYSNGQSEEVQVRDRIRAGRESRVIDLRGRNRAISSVEFWYAKANYRSQRPMLKLYGR